MRAGSSRSPHCGMRVCVSVRCPGVLRRCRSQASTRERHQQDLSFVEAAAAVRCASLPVPSRAQPRTGFERDRLDLPEVPASTRLLHHLRRKGLDRATDSVAPSAQRSTPPRQPIAYAGPPSSTLMDAVALAAQPRSPRSSHRPQGVVAAAHRLRPMSRCMWSSARQRGLRRRTDARGELAFPSCRHHRPTRALATGDERLSSSSKHSRKHRRRRARGAARARPARNFA